MSTHGEKYLLVLTIELREITGTSFRGVYLEIFKKFNTFNGWRAMRIATHMVRVFI